MSGSELEQRLQTNRRLFGDEVFRLVADQEGSSELELGGLAGPTKAAVEQLDAALTAIRLHNFQPDHPLDLAVQSWSNLLRGVFGRFSVDDDPDAEVRDRIVALGKTVYPFLLINSGITRTAWGNHFGSFHAIVDYRRQAAVAEAVAGLPEISDLLPGDQDRAWVGQIRFITASSAGSIQTITLLSNILQGAMMRMRLNGEVLLERFVAEVGMVYDRMLLEARGEVGPERLLVCRGIGLKTNEPTTVGNLELLPWTEAANGLIQQGAAPSHMHGTYLGFSIVMEDPVPLVLKTFEPSGPPGDWSQKKENQASYDQLDSTARNLNLAAFLSLDGDRPSGVQHSYTTSLSPWALGSAGFTTDRASSTPQILDDTQAEDFAEWFVRIEQTDIGYSKIALDRVHRAVLHRRDPVDVIVDCVIAWDNLFGDSQSELGFRISASMAKLLSNDAEKRLELQKEIGKLYGLRSQLVHGGKPPSDLRDKSVRVLELTRLVLRELYEHRPEALKVQPGAAKMLLADV